jgi:hypothetical protein
MSLLLDIARIAAGVNVVLLVAIGYVWARNYRQIRSKQTLGSLIFVAFLLAENLLALYYYLTIVAPLPDAAIRAMMYLQILEAGGLLVLAYVIYE